MTVDHKFGSNCDQGSSRPLWRPGGALASAFVLIGLVVAATAAIAGRGAVVSIAPTTAAVYASVGMPVNLRGLMIADVRATVTQQADGQEELLVTGEIANLRDEETRAPNLRLALCGKDGRELYVWTARAPRIVLGPASAFPSGRGWWRLRPAFGRFW